MKNLDEMSVEEVLRTINLNLVDNDIDVILGRDTEALTELQRLLAQNKQDVEKMKSQKSQTAEIFGIKIDNVDTNLKLHELNSQAVQDIFTRFSNVVNKYFLVLLTTYNSQKRLEEEGKKLDPKLKIIIKQDIDIGLKLIGKKDVTVAVPMYDKNTDLFKSMKIVNSTKLAKQIRNGEKLDGTNTMSKKKFARLKEIDERVGLRNLVQAITYEDLQYIVADNEQVGSGLMYALAWNSAARFFETHPEQKDNIHDGVVSEEFQERIRRSEEHIATFEEVLMQNCRYINIDNLLLMAAFRYIEMVERDDENLSIDEIKENGIQKNDKEKSIKLINIILGLIKNEVSKDASFDISFEETGEEVKYSLEDLENDLKRFKDGRYIKKSDTAVVKERLLANDTNFLEIELRQIALMDLTAEDIHKALLNCEENIIFTINNIKPDGEVIYVVLNERGECSQELFSLIVQKELLDIKQICKLFNNGIIGIEHLKNIENEEILSELREINMEFLRDTYLSVSDKEKELDPEIAELFDKHRALYMALNIEGKTSEEIEENSFRFISSFEDDIDSERLEGLYQYGIISLEDAADWGVDLNQMLANNSIKPTDLKNLYQNGTITIDAIRNVLINGALPYEEKLDLIYSTFDGESEEEYNLREELVGILETGEEYKAETGKTKRRKNNETTIKSREFVTDPHARWKLISLLDKDYSKKFLPAGCEVVDGHRVFLLPNQDKIVIEKMHEKRHGRKVSAYASATYIMETEEFFKNINSLIIEGAINRTALREISEEDKATKIIHSTSWGNKIKEYFGIDAQNERYTEEEIAKIDKAIENVEKSRKERE